MTHPTSSLPEQFLQHVRHRGRVFTTAGALARGVPDSSIRRALREGECHRHGQGLYSLDAAMDLRSQIWAGLLIAGPRATLGGGTAVFVRGDGPEPATIDIWTGHRSLTDRGPWRFHRGTSPDLPPEGDERSDEALARLATTRGDVTSPALDAAQRQLSLAQRERFLDVAEEQVPGGQCFLEARFASEVARPHGLVEPRWSPVVDSTGPVLEARLLGGAVHIVLDPRREVMPRWGRNGYAAGFVDEYRSEVSVTFRWDDIALRSCLTASRLHQVLRMAGVPVLLESCGSCDPLPTAPGLSVLGAPGWAR